MPSYNRITEDSDKFGVFLYIVAVLLTIAAVGGGCYVLPQYRVYSRTQTGLAELRQAESNRRIKVLEAVAEREAAESYKHRDSIRAVGIAQSNKIIGQSLHQNPEYLTWLKIEAMKDTENRLIYVPTEAMLPITEAGRR